MLKKASDSENSPRISIAIFYIHRLWICLEISEIDGNWRKVANSQSYFKVLVVRGFAHLETHVDIFGSNLLRFVVIPPMMSQFAIFATSVNNKFATQIPYSWIANDISNLHRLEIRRSISEMAGKRAKMARRQTHFGFPWVRGFVHLVTHMNILAGISMSFVVISTRRSIFRISGMSVNSNFPTVRSYWNYEVRLVDYRIAVVDVKMLESRESPSIFLNFQRPEISRRVRNGEK